MFVCVPGVDEVVNPNEAEACKIRNATAQAVKYMRYA
jgi:hypothetical protein